MGKVVVERDKKSGAIYLSGGEGQECPLMIYRLSLWLAPDHEFVACVYHQEGKFGSVVYEDNRLACHRDGLRQFSRAHADVWPGLLRVFRRLRVWVKTREYEAR